MADLAQLQAFVAVARLGGVGRAAVELGRTQPAISARIRELESRWQVLLFRRRARGMALTPEGARLLPAAEAALQAVERVDRAAGLPLAADRRLRLGCGDAVGRIVLPRALRELRQEHPELTVQVVEAPGAGLLAALREGRIDLAIVVEPEPEQAGSGLQFEPLIESAIELLEPTDPSSPPRGRADPRGLRGRDLVTLQPGSGFRRALDRRLRERGIELEPRIEVGNLSLVRRFVAAGLGVAPVPAVAFEDLDPGSGVRRRPFRGLAPLSYRLARREGAPLSETARHFIDRVQQK